MPNKDVLISGAGIAGPSLAYWLARYGFHSTVVERAAGLRGGFAVDFRGQAHLMVLERMGILDELRRLQTGGSPYSFVDENGRELANLPPEFAGGDVEVYRGDLSRVLYERTRQDSEYVFGDSIASIKEAPNGVRVTFEQGPPRTFGIVVGADGLHSNVRRIVFGPEPEFISHLGYYFASWSLRNHCGASRARLMYNVPGKLASTGADHRDRTKAGAFVVFAFRALNYDPRDVEGQKKIVAEVFAKVGWQVPTLIDAMWDAADLYFDSIARIDVQRWSKGRVVLLGDAGCGATLGGMGVGTAVVSAYVLAGELAAARGEPQMAFARYEASLRHYVEACQKGGDRAGTFLAPRTSKGIRIRNWVLRSRLLSALLLKQGQKVASNVALRNYPS